MAVKCAFMLIKVAPMTLVLHEYKRFLLLILVSALTYFTVKILQLQQYKKRE